LLALLYSTFLEAWRCLTAHIMFFHIGVRLFSWSRHGLAGGPQMPGNTGIIFAKALPRDIC
jgi:hypothetical protein